MDWHTRMVWWLLLATLLELALVSVVADSRSASTEERNLVRPSDKSHSNIDKYGYKEKPTPMTKQKFRYRSTRVFRKTTTAANYWYLNSSPATPVDTGNASQQPSINKNSRCSGPKCANGGWSQPLSPQNHNNTGKTFEATTYPTIETEPSEPPFTGKLSSGPPDSSRGVSALTPIEKNQTAQRTIIHTTSVTEKDDIGLHNNSGNSQPTLSTSKTSSSSDTTPPAILKEGKPVHDPVQPPMYPGYSGSQNSGRQWRPPGYVPISSIITGLNVTISDGSHLGYSKDFFKPSSPTIILQIPNYHYPSGIPLKVTRGCCVKDATAVCISNLKDKRIPSSVNSSVTTIFIKSEEVDYLSIDAFRNVEHVKYINITDTKLTSLPRDLFRDTKNLKHLVVQKNSKLKSLHSDVFRDAYNLEDVILEHNSISSLDRDVFTHLTNVKRLNLGYNKIRTLPQGIFRGNRELEELMLTGNPLQISSDIPQDLLRNNTKLRVLLLSSCELDGLPTGLLEDASNMEWLDLSHNNITKFPVEFIQDCTKLGFLDLSYNKLTVLSADVLHQHGGHLAVLRLEGNPWHCDCDLLPLASWSTLRHESVPAWPKCSSPLSVRNDPLQRWFHSADATECGRATSSLRTHLNRILSTALAIAEEGPDFINFLNISDNGVSFIATNYFAHAMAARSDTGVGSIVWRWTQFLEDFLDRRHLRHTDAKAKTGTGYTFLDRSAATLENVSEEQEYFYFDSRLGPLATSTTKPPAASLQQMKDFEPLVNLTFIMTSIPENHTKLVDDGIEEELKALFGVIRHTNTTSLNISTGTTTIAKQNTSVVTPAPFSPNSTVSITAPINQAPTIRSTFLPATPFSLLLNIFSVLAISTITLLPDNSSSEIPVNAFLNSITLTNSSSTANQNVTNSTYPLAGYGATTTPASVVPGQLMKLNATEVVASLRSELREVLSILLQSIDRANWDTAYQKYIEEEEKKILTSPKQPDVSKSQQPTSAMSKPMNTAESSVLIQPRLTVLVPFFTLLVHTLM